MNINKVGLGVPYSSKAAFFRGSKNENEYENPISRSTERNLAILGSAGTASILGLIAWGLTSCLGFKEKRTPIIWGVSAAALTLLLLLPANIYNTKVRAFAKQKEMDVFTRDRNLKTNLTEDVDKEVQNPEVSLDKKLDDNLKLQTANRGSALVVAGMNSQPQEAKPAQEVKSQNTKQA